MSWDSKVAVIDSSYYLIITLSTKQTGKIFVRQNRNYQIGGLSDAEEITFWRVVRGIATRQCVDQLSQRLFGYENNFTTVIDSEHPLQDTILLDKYLPLERGDYLVSVNISYLYFGKKEFKYFAPVSLKVDFVPKRSLSN